MRLGGRKVATPCHRHRHNDNHDHQRLYRPNRRWPSLVICLKYHHLARRTLIIQMTCYYEGEKEWESGSPPSIKLNPSAVDEPWLGLLK